MSVAEEVVNQNELENIEDINVEGNDNDSVTEDILSSPILEVPEPEFELQSRYWFYCREWKLGRLPLEDVYLTVVEEASSALCPEPSDSPFIAKVEDQNGTYYWKVMDVEDGWALCHSFDGTEDEDQIHISELQPVYLNETDREMAEERTLTIDMYKFYMTFIFRQWDRFDENSKTIPFEPILRRRLNLCELIAREAIPQHSYYRFNRQRLDFGKAYDELDQIHAVLQQVQGRLRDQSDDEKVKVDEEKFYESVYNDYLYYYSVWKVQADRLQELEDSLWDNYQITTNGRVPIVRRKNGPRDFNELKIVYHLVAENLSVKQIGDLNLPDDAVVKTYGHEKLTEALANCYENDQVILFPGVYDLSEYLFHESITVRGCGKTPSEVVILGEDDEPNFIFGDAENLKFENLTFEARRNTEGCVIINGGHCEMRNCILNCDEITRGIIIRPYATVTISKTIIKGTDEECSIILEPASTLVDGGENDFGQTPFVNQLKVPRILTPATLSQITKGQNDSPQIEQKIFQKNSPRIDGEGVHPAGGDTIAV